MTEHFIALLLRALMESQIGRAVARRHLASFLLYPAARRPIAPGAERIIQAFTAVARHQLTDAAGNRVQTSPRDLTPIQQQLHAVLAVPSDLDR